MRLETRTKTRFDSRALYNKFLELFDSEPILVRSPGRINLIGEHTDYNNGFVMPAAIDRDIVVAINFAQESHSTLYSVKHNEFFSFHTTNPEKVSSPLWANYLLGVVRQFIDKGYAVKSFHCVVDGDVPTGGGLSSSAALECSFAFAMDHLHQFNIPKLQLILIAQWAEHHYVGVMCGIMDQFASMMGREGKAFVLDCRSLEYHYFPLDMKECSIVLCDTMVKHSLASSAYNTRRKECEQGVEIIRQHYPAVKSLRDVTHDMIENQREKFPAKVYNRCLYVVQENQRVLDAAQDLDKGDLNAFGRKMYATHDGLSRLYEVSCPELDFLVGLSKKADGVLGSRMMGGGFGGCTINLVQKDAVKAFIAMMEESYLGKFKVDMASYVVSLKDGTGLINTSHLK